MPIYREHMIMIIVNTWCFVGADCRESSDDCLNHGCQNGAECVDQHQNYTCRCEAAYMGRFCENLIQVSHWKFQLNRSVLKPFPSLCENLIPVCVKTLSQSVCGKTLWSWRQASTISLYTSQSSLCENPTHWSHCLKTFSWSVCVKTNMNKALIKETAPWWEIWLLFKYYSVTSLL